MKPNAQRDSVIDSFTYISLNKQCSSARALRNKSTYFGLSVLAALLGSVGSIIIWGIFIWIFVELSEFLKFSEIISKVVVFGSVFGAIRTAIIGYSLILRPFTRSFLRNGLRPFFLIKEVPNDPYIGRIFIDKMKRVVTIYSQGGFLNENGKVNYYTYYVENGIQRNGDAYAEVTLSQCTLIDNPPSI